MATKQEKDYIGVCPHGVAVFWCVDDPDTVRSCADDMADMLKRGFTIEHVAGAAARKRISELRRCTQCNPKSNDASSGQAELYG